MKHVTIAKIDNGYLVQELPVGYTLAPPSLQFAKDLDAVFAIVERLFAERERKPDSER